MEGERLEEKIVVLLLVVTLIAGLAGGYAISNVLLPPSQEKEPNELQRQIQERDAQIKEKDELIANLTRQLQQPEKIGLTVEEYFKNWEKFGSDEIIIVTGKVMDVGTLLAELILGPPYKETILGVHFAGDTKITPEGLWVEGVLIKKGDIITIAGEWGGTYGFYTTEYSQYYHSFINAKLVKNWSR